MSIPEAVTTATVHHDAPISFGGEPGRVMARFTPSATLIWEDTGTPLASFFDAVSPENGAPLEIELPHTDQSGFVDGSGNTLENWHYSVKIWFFKDGQNISFPSRDFQISSGQSDVDLALIPWGEAVDPTVAPMAYVTSVNGQTGDLEIESLQGPEGPAGPEGPEGPQGDPGPIVPLDSLTDVTAPTPSDGQALVWDNATSKWINATISTANIALDSLTDVTAPTPGDGDALVWDAGTSRWVATGSFAATLNELTDVDTSGAADEDVLTYDSGTGTWVPAAPTGGGTWDGIQVTSPATGEPLIYDSATSKWVNATRTKFTPSTGTLQLHASGNDVEALQVTINPGASPSYFAVAGSGYIKKMNGSECYISIVGSTSAPGAIATDNGLQVGLAGYNSGPGRLWHKTWGWLGSATPDQGWATPTQSTAYATKTTNYTLVPRDEFVIFNGSSLTATLPDPTLDYNKGRIYRIKNVHASALSIVSAGTSKTIDGGASFPLNQYDSVVVVSDGVQWLIYSAKAVAPGGGADLIQTSTYNPTVTGLNGSSTSAFRVIASGNNTTAAVTIDTTGASVQKMGMWVNVTNLGTGHAMAVGRNGIFGAAWDRFGTQTRVSEIDMTFGGTSSVPTDSNFVQSGALIHSGGLIWVKRGTGSNNFNVHPLGHSATPSTKTSNYTLVYSDTTVIFNGSNLTATIPAANTSGMNGREFTIKNIHSTALTITGASNFEGTLPSLTLSAWDKVTIMSDGSQWLVTKGRKPFAISTTAPSSPVEGDVWFDIS